ncbi:uncharacterized protein [Anabrus simplex]
MESRSGCHIPLLKTCCLFNSLRGGVYYIAILCMVGSVNNFIIFCTQYDRIAKYVPLLKMMDVSMEDRDQLKIIALIMLGTLATVWFMVSALLFYGAFKDRSKCMVPWMVLCGASLPLCLGVVITVATLFFIYMSPLYGALSIVFGLLMIGVPTYFLWVVYSFYRELEDLSDDREKGPFIVHPHNYFN